MRGVDLMKKGWLVFILGLVLLLSSISFAERAGTTLETNILLFIGCAFLVTFFVGNLAERIKIPWIFGALFFGLLLAFHNPFPLVTNSETFSFLSQLGMYFLLFMIGFELDIKEMRKAGRHIVASTIVIIFLEAVVGSVFVHVVLGYDWVVAFLVAMSFATVGEAVLIPILDEFKIVNTRLGQMIIGIGTLDDVIELVSLILVVSLLGAQSHTQLDMGLVLTSLVVLFCLTVGLSKLKRHGQRFAFMSIETLFLFCIAIFFLFLGIGEYADMAPLAALMAGIALNSFIPKTRLKPVEDGIRTVGYGLFAPLFFIWVGASLNIGYLLASPLLLIAVIVVSNSAKLAGSYLMGRDMGWKRSIIMGIGLSARFSTSVVVVKLMYDDGLIRSDLYSIIIASSIIFTIIIPILFSYLLVRWKITGKK